MWKEFKHKHIDPLHHKLNPLHVYCRLVEMNIMSNRKAKLISMIYDKLIYRILYLRRWKNESN